MAVPSNRILNAMPCTWYAVTLVMVTGTCALPLPIESTSCARTPSETRTAAARTIRRMVRQGQQARCRMAEALLAFSPMRTAALAALLLSATIHAATLPSGFTESTIASGLAAPTAMALAPDGRIFICQQTGALRVVKNNALLATPFITLSVNSSGERGLLGVAFD